ncbi:MAG: PD40 domain-containing protein, partial [Holophagae bacterium]|nr:PD40 domain-containing protein [Holophagae bacterium]
MKRIFSVLVALTVGLLVYAGPFYFLSEPDISPDGDKVVFCYNSDIWTVAKEGGTAHRLTAMAGTETRPRISPDGQWLAFTGTLNGNRNVFVMPVAGGPVTQLTFNDSADTVDSWSWDSRFIYFTSSRYNAFTSCRVPREGGTPERLLNGYFNTIHGITENPIDKSILFTDSWESGRFADRKGYKGPFNPDILSYNLTTDTFKELTHWEGKDFNPVMDRAGTLYFISDQCDSKGGVTNLYTLADGKKAQLTDFAVSVRNPRVSADGKTVVFEKGYRLFLYDTTEKKANPLDVELFSDPSLTLSISCNVKGEITAFDVSPDEKKLAFVSRGELFVSDIAGKFIRKLETDPQGRVLEVKWMKDSRRLIFNQTVHGWQNWFTIPADGSAGEKALTETRGNDRDLALSHDGTMAVYLSGLHDVKLIDLETMKTRTLATENLWGFYNSPPSFSPDNAYVVFTAYRNFEEDIFLTNLKTGETLNITHTGVSESSPSFSSDGKYLYFASDRIHPSYPRGADGVRIYRVALEKLDADFRSGEFEKLFKPEKKTEGDKKDKKAEKDKEKAEKPKPVTVKIDLTDFLNRFDRVSPDHGNQNNPLVLVKKETHHVIYRSDHVDGKPALFQTSIEPFEKRKTVKIKESDGISPGRFATVKDKIWVLKSGKVYSLDLKQNKLKEISIDCSFSRNLKSEFTQMFDEVWANLNDNYYDSNFHGRNWAEVHGRYRKFLPFVTNRADLRKLISNMLGELNSSHMGFYSNGKEEKGYYKQVTATVGLVFDNEKPFQVAEILRESPLDKVDKDVLPGDELLAVNDRKAEPELNREALFAFAEMPKELSLKFKRGNRTFTVRVHPESSRKLTGRLYNRWEDLREKKVEKESKGQIYYFHMKDMGQSELDRFLVHMAAEGWQHKALILDLRNNMGGNVHDDVLQYLSRKLYAKWKYRGGEMSPQPNFFPASSPIVLMVNRMTLSDGEMTAAGFRALKLGSIVGTGTYRWLIFTSGKRLVDGSYFRMPSWGCYTVDG